MRIVNLEKNPNSLTVAWAYVPTGFATPEAVDELPNEPNLHI